MGKAIYFRPLLATARDCGSEAVMLGGGWTWFDRLEVLERGKQPRVIAVNEAPADVIERLTGKRADIAGLSMARANVMGIVNVTPDSFSDGGDFLDDASGIAHGCALAKAGADILDIGGESTRPGADYVPAKDEIARVLPVIAGVIEAGVRTPISVDTRKADVAHAALDVGAMLINDVSALSHDVAMAGVAAETGAPVCLMHAQGSPKTMQDDPTYGDVVLDIYDALSAAAERAIEAGVSRERIILDPGIGFGKTTAHNLELLARLSLFHALGFPLLVGASRKRFIGEVGNTSVARDRVAGSVAVACQVVAQGCQFVRVHDVEETRQALALWQAIAETG